MSLQAKRELLVQVACRYREARVTQKSVILDEFVATTGYARKYAIRLLAHPTPAPAASMRRPRGRRYGPTVQEALTLCWSAANGICAKRLVPFLPELVPALERHGHLTLSAEDRTQLLAISAATADRLLRPQRDQSQPHGITTTKPGALLKRQIPVRTFQDWDDAKPGYMEADLVAHCGYSAEGAFLYTLVLTDVVTGWTECLPLLHRSQHAVIQALDRVRQLLPFPLLGMDTDNGSEFLNAELFGYCGREQITFTRGRTGKKNDQCFVEQKNGSIVRHLVGYDRFEGEPAYRQLTELYRAVRLYVNFFQPSMKLATKHRDRSTVHRTYDPARTPFQRLLTAGVLPVETRSRLDVLAAALDPVRLLRQLETLQDALWRHAVFRTPARVYEAPHAGDDAARFDLQQCGLGDEDGAGQAGGEIARLEVRSHRKYRRSTKVPGPRWWRTRDDPFATVWEEVQTWLAANPERTATALLLELQQRYPGQYVDGQLRTLERRVKDWRDRTILTFDTQWLLEEVLTTQTRPRPLPADSSSGDTDVPQSAAVGQ
jgi:hypothetical protein